MHYERAALSDIAMFHHLRRFPDIGVSGLREFFSHASYTVFEHQAQTTGATSMA